MLYFNRFRRILILITVLFSVNFYKSNGLQINIVKYGADNTGKVECSNFFQQAINELLVKGGGTVYIPKGDYLIKYSIFIPSNINIIGEGELSRIIANISLSEGRCAFVVGNSYEWNYERMELYRSQGKRGWLANEKYTDPTIAYCLERKSNDITIETRNSSIQNLLIEFDYTDCGSNWGGYGIQFCNTADSFARNIWTKNACQAVGIGSDAGLSTPGCVNVFCYNIHVLKPDPIHTYYAIGFISSSNNCGIINVDSYIECTDNSDDGSLIAFNFVKNCTFENIKGSVGRTNTSEGILINNAYGCIVKNVLINNAKKGLAISFTDYNMLQNYKKLRNKIDSIKISNSDYGVVLYSKFNEISNVLLTKCQIPIIYNINATNNIFVNFNFSSLSKERKKWIEDNNYLR